MLLGNSNGILNKSFEANSTKNLIDAYCGSVDETIEITFSSHSHLSLVDSVTPQQSK